MLPKEKKDELRESILKSAMGKILREILQEEEIIESLAVCLMKSLSGKEGPPVDKT